MLLGKNNFNYLVINYEKFDINNIYFDYDRNKDFININYKNLIDFEGIHLYSPNIKMLNSIKLIDVNNINKKYVLEMPLDDNLIFSKIFKNFDNQISDYLKSNQMFKHNRYIRNIKYGYYKNKYKYKTVKLKINSNNCIFYYNNQKYDGDILDLDLSKMIVKCYISSHGLWKFEQNYGMTWRCLKLYFYDIQHNQPSQNIQPNNTSQGNITDNIDYYIKNDLVQKIDNNYNQPFDNYTIGNNMDDSDEDQHKKEIRNNSDNSDSSDGSENSEDITKNGINESQKKTIHKKTSHNIPNFELDIDF
jgi:hypothetical protein